MKTVIKSSSHENPLLQPGSRPVPGPETTAPPAPDAGAIDFDREIDRRIRKRLEAEIQRLHNHISLIEADRTALRLRLDERERFAAAVETSRPWKLMQWARGLVGRRW